MLRVDPDIVKSRKACDPSNRRVAEIDVRADDLFPVQYFLLQHLTFPPSEYGNLGYTPSAHRLRYSLPSRSRRSQALSPVIAYADGDMGVVSVAVPYALVIRHKQSSRVQFDQIGPALHKRIVAAPPAIFVSLCHFITQKFKCKLILMSKTLLFLQICAIMSTMCRQERKK